MNLQNVKWKFDIKIYYVKIFQSQKIWLRLQMIEIFCDWNVKIFVHVYKEKKYIMKHSFGCVDFILYYC